MRALLLMGMATAALVATGELAQANVIYVGYSFDGGNTIVQAGSSGSSAFAAFNVNVGGFQIQVSGTGAPTTPQGTLLSNSTTVSSSTAGNVQIFVSETGNTLNAVSFTTGFGNNSLSTTNVTETTYATAGTSPFGEANQLATAIVAPGQAMSNSTVAAPAGLGSLYTLTSMYSITYGSGGGMTTSTLNVQGTAATAVPEPATLALLGLGAAGLVAARRRRAA